MKKKMNGVFLFLYCILMTSKGLAFVKVCIFLYLMLTMSSNVALHLDLELSHMHFTLLPGIEGWQVGSGSGSATRPLSLNLNLPPWEVFLDLVEEHNQTDLMVRRLIESPVQSVEGFEARQQILDNLKTFLDGFDIRLDQARELACDQERARQHAEQMAPLAQTEAQFDAQRRADEEARRLLPPSDNYGPKRNS